MTILENYVVRNATTNFYLLAIGEEDEAPSSGFWTNNLNEAKRYGTEEQALEIANGLNKVFRHNPFNIEAIVSSFKI